MKNYENISILFCSEEMVTIRYKGFDLRRYGLISTCRHLAIINDRYVNTNVEHCGIGKTDKKYHAGFIKGYKTWWGAKRSVNRTKNFYSPAVVYC